MALRLRTAALPAGEVGMPYGASIRATGQTAAGGPTTYNRTLGNFPPGLNFEPTGMIWGTPTAEGTYAFSVTATDTTGTTPAVPFTIQINPAAPAPGTGGPGTPIAGGTNPLRMNGVRFRIKKIRINAKADQPLFYTIEVNGGTMPYRYEPIGSIPGGLMLTEQAAGAELHGVPRRPGKYHFSVVVRDANQERDVTEIELHVSEPGSGWDRFVRGLRGE